MTHDARPSYFNLLNLELCKECSRTLGRAWAGIQLGLQADACNRGAAAIM